MNAEHRDDIDRAIDEALASAFALEPRRVSARSVRRALNESRSSRIPVWLAAAALLVVSFAWSIRTRGPIIERSGSATNRSTIPRSADPAVEKLSPSASVSGSAGMTNPASALRSARGPGRSERFDDSQGIHGGLPRLAIASIEPPEPLSTRGLDASVIQIPPIEIAPLFVSSLPIEQEHDQ